MRLNFFGLFLAFFSLPAIAGPKPLFLISKPDNPQNLVQTFVNVDERCKIGDVDFLWLRFSPDPDGNYVKSAFYSSFYGKPAYVKTPNEILHCQILKRIKPIAVPANSKVACFALPPPEQASCDHKALTSDELNKVSGAAPVVVRAEKDPVSGKCSVGAFMETEGMVFRVGQISAEGSVRNGMLSKTVLFTKISVRSASGQSPAPWSCVRNCQETFGMEMLSCR